MRIGCEKRNRMYVPFRPVPINWSSIARIWSCAVIFATQPLTDPPTERSRAVFLNDHTPSDYQLEFGVIAASCLSTVALRVTAKSRFHECWQVCPVHRLAVDWRLLVPQSPWVPSATNHPSRAMKISRHINIISIDWQELTSRTSVTSWTSAILLIGSSKWFLMNITNRLLIWLSQFLFLAGLKYVISLHEILLK